MVYIASDPLGCFNHYCQAYSGNIEKSRFLKGPRLDIVPENIYFNTHRVITLIKLSYSERDSFPTKMTRGRPGN